MSYYAFTGHVGTEPDWVNPGNAHDGDLATYAQTTPGWGHSSGSLYLTVSPPAPAVRRVELYWLTSPGSSSFRLYAKTVEYGWLLTGMDPPWPPSGAPAWDLWNLWGLSGTLQAIRLYYTVSFDWERVYESRFWTPEPWSPLVARTYFFLA